MKIAEKILKSDKNSERNMPEKDPQNYALLTYLWVFLLSAWGGLVSFINKVKTGETRRFNVIELIGELCTSAFAGVLTFWACEHANLAPLLTAAFVGISGHMGSRAIFNMEKFFDRWTMNRYPSPTAKPNNEDQGE